MNHYGILRTTSGVEGTFGIAKVAAPTASTKTIIEKSGKVIRSWIVIRSPD